MFLLSMHIQIILKKKQIGKPRYLGAILLGILLARFTKQRIEECQDGRFFVSPPLSLPAALVWSVKPLHAFSSKVQQLIWSVGL